MTPSAQRTPSYLKAAALIVRQGTLSHPHTHTETQQHSRDHQETHVLLRTYIQLRCVHQGPWLTHRPIQNTRTQALVDPRGHFDTAWTHPPATWRFPHSTHSLFSQWRGLHAHQNCSWGRGHSECVVCWRVCRGQSSRQSFWVGATFMHLCTQTRPPTTGAESQQFAVTVVRKRRGNERRKTTRKQRASPRGVQVMSGGRRRSKRLSQREDASSEKAGSTLRDHFPVAKATPVSPAPRLWRDHVCWCPQVELSLSLVLLCLLCVGVALVYLFVWCRACCGLSSACGCVSTCVEGILPCCVDVDVPFRICVLIILVCVSPCGCAVIQEHQTWGPAT